MVDDNGCPVGVISLKEIMGYLSRIDIGIFFLHLNESEVFGSASSLIFVARDQKIAAERKKELVKVFYSYKPLIKEVKPIVDKTGHSV